MVVLSGNDSNADALTVIQSKVFSICRYAESHVNHLVRIGALRNELW